MLAMGGSCMVLKIIDVVLDWNVKIALFIEY